MFANESFTATTGKPNADSSKRRRRSTAAPRPMTASVNGGGTDEASLDVQQVLGGAPGASVTFVGIPGSNQSFSDAYYDNCAGQNKPSTSSAPRSANASCSILPAYNNGLGLHLPACRSELQPSPKARPMASRSFSVRATAAALGCPSNSYFAINATGATFQPGVESYADDPERDRRRRHQPHHRLSGGLHRQSVDTRAVDLCQRERLWRSGRSRTIRTALGSRSPAVTGAPAAASAPCSPSRAYQTLVNSGSSTVPHRAGCRHAGRRLPRRDFDPSRVARQRAVRCDRVDRRNALRLHRHLGRGPGIRRSAVAVASAERARSVQATFRAGGYRQSEHLPLHPGSRRRSRPAAPAAPASAAVLSHEHLRASTAITTAPRRAPGYNYITGNGTPDVKNLFGMASYPSAG